MMSLLFRCSLISLLIFLFFTISSAFYAQIQCCSSDKVIARTSNPRLVKSTGIRSAKAIEDEQPLTNMREEIEKLRSEAIKRVEALSKEAEEVEENLIHGVSGVGTRPQKNTGKLLKNSDDGSINIHSKNDKIEKNALEGIWEQNPPHSLTDSGTKISKKTRDTDLGKPMPMQVEKSQDLNLLDNTHWKVMLDIGRDPGTWMPKTWGASGKRMLLNLEICFEADQLYDREEFLEGVGNAKVCRVVHHELNIAPTMTEGIKRVFTLKDGGWRVVKGAGPLGTDVLRFFIETDAEIRQGDVCVPSGRIYFTCGYFVMHRPSGIKDYLRSRMADIEERVIKIREELQEEGFFSLKRLKLSKELFELELKEAASQKAFNEAAVVEPDKSLLRVSRRGDVGLTREGGVCCKVKKGPVTEYHILGRFGVAAIEPRREER